jgi:hypothetical protein
MGPQRITFGDIREMGLRGVLVYCADYHCSHSVALSADRWADDIRLSDGEPRFVCAACGKRRSRSFAGPCGLLSRWTHILIGFVSAFGPS